MLNGLSIDAWRPYFWQTIKAETQREKCVDRVDHASQIRMFILRAYTLIERVKVYSAARLLVNVCVRVTASFNSQSSFIREAEQLLIRSLAIRLNNSFGASAKRRI